MQGSRGTAKSISDFVVSFLRNLEGKENGMFKNVKVKTEVLAGLTTFFAISYVIIVNSIILSEAGIPPELSVFGTIFVSAIGCLLMGFFGKLPLIITTGMGVNSFFTYTLVYSLKLSWQEALAVSFVSGIVCLVIALTPLASKLTVDVPESLKHGITAGIGLFLVIVGLEQGGIIVKGKETFMELNSFLSPVFLLTICSLVLTLILFIRKVQGSFFISIIVTTVVANLLGLVEPSNIDFSLSHLKDYPSIVANFDFSHILSISFILGVFSLAMILIFEAMGLLNGLIDGITKDQFKRGFFINGLVILFSSILGTSPTIPAAESATGIQEGGRTGLTAITAGIAFLCSLFAIPFLSYIPSSALAPVILITGGLMMQNIRFIQIDDFAEWFPPFLMISLMAFSMSISDGLAFGFVSYPIVKVIVGQRKKINATTWVISFLFLLYLVGKVML